MTHPYGEVRLAPTTLRYCKVLCDLVALFPQFATIDEIAEIGVGHGGQARIVADYAARAGTGLKTYTCIDLMPVLFLARQYLEHFVLKPQFRFLSKVEIGPDWRCGLVLSNYAFSELGRALQEDYLERVLLRAGAGYLTMNSGLFADEWQGRPCLTAEALLTLLPNAVLLYEEPLSAPYNYIVVFGRHAAGTGTALVDVRHRATARAAEAPPRKERRGLFAKRRRSAAGGD